MAATLGHFGLAMCSIPRFNEHANNRAKRVHFNRSRGTIAIDALKRRLWESKPFLKRKVRRVTVALIGKFNGKRVVDGRVVYTFRAGIPGFSHASAEKKPHFFPR